MPKTVFIAWSGPLGLQVAEGLKKTLEINPDLETFVSSDITDGNWMQKLDEMLTKADFCIVCLTPGASIKPWVNFESGFIIGRRKRLKLLKVGENLDGVFPIFQGIDSATKDDFSKLLKDMVADNAVERWTNFMFDDWQQVLNRLDAQIKLEIAIEERVKPIFNVLGNLKSSKQIQDNICMQRIIVKSLRDISAQLEHASTSSYIAPAGQYPYYLVALQKELDARVRAVALVEQEETFWTHAIAREILNGSHPKSERVFVFTKETDFHRHKSILEQHARQYDVYVVSIQKLVREFIGFTKDFAIIEAMNREASGHRILAIYDRQEIQKNIHFIADQREIDKHADAFKLITDAAIKIPKTILENQKTADEILREIGLQIFEEITGFDLRPVEMSSYISVENYDRYEERHAYYDDMMQKMIALFETHRRKDGGRVCRLLELGAGTGIFTRRLAQLPEVEEVVACEIDWVCFQKLKHNLHEYRHVRLLDKDSRTYDPGGQFKYIFSSFSDHHIKPQDKPRYFANIKRNLEPGGLFIVGDEFLRSHNATDELAREQALHAYHDHIIELARQDNNPILAELEEAALESGLTKKGDFKVSCVEYEEILNRAGLRVVEKIKIGPLDIDDIGGVYVYTIQARM